MLLETQPFDLKIGETYTVEDVSRMIENYSIKSNTVTFLENHFYRGYCSIEDFYEWLDRVN